MASIDGVGVVFKVTASAAKINCWWDRIAYGTSLTIYGGTEASPATFADIVSAEETNKYGIITEVQGVLMCQGKLILGSTTLGQDTYFKDTSKVIVFMDRAFGTFYDIKLQGNATATVQEIYFGEKSGARGISGCMFRSVGASKFTVTATDVNVLKMGFYGCVFYDGSTISLPSSATNREVIDCTFEKCGIVSVNLCKVQYCNFVSADSDGITVDSTSFNVTDCNFINPTSHGVEITATGTYTFDNFQFAGTSATGPYDVENTTAGLVTIINSNDSNTAYYENTGGGTTDIQSGVTLKVTVKDPSGNAIVGARVLM